MWAPEPVLNQPWPSAAIPAAGAIPQRNGGAARLSRILARALILSLCLAPLAGRADPWLNPGDIQARQDVELLSDTGVIDIPITTWPLPWGSIAAQLATLNPDALSPAQQLAYNRLLTGIEAVQAGGDELGYEVAAAPGRAPLNWFGNTTRGKEQAAISYSGYYGLAAFRLNLIGVYGSSDHQRGRFDGSYVSFALGNWILTAGQVEQWWGPAWSGSLILGTNARPAPGVIFSRNVATPFNVPVLKLLGPWTLTVFAQRLENDRYVPHPFLLGARLAFRPLAGVEFGLSRTAEFGGEGRQQGWYCIWQTFIGRTNRNLNNLSSDCSNQLAAFDTRFHIPHTDMDFYSQWNAEDSGGGYPSKWSDLFGLSYYGPVGSDGGNYRTFLEYANTTTDSYKGGVPNFEYENLPVYHSGYRYRGVSLGYPTDNDSELWTAGVTLQGADDGGLTFLLQHGTLNRDNTNVNEPWGGNKIAPVRTGLNEVDAYYTPSFWSRHLTLNLGVTRWAPFGLPVETGVHGQLIWQQAFSD